MTLWNPLNVFANAHRTVADGHPSASFDPRRPGAPTGPDVPSPAIGVGGASVGKAASIHGEPHRNPIGFAPPNNEVEPRFRTELSFKRHHDLPRASATQGGADDGALESWQTPDVVDADDHEVSGAAGQGADESSPVGAGVEKVPFYKREIGFRRKASPSEASSEPDLDEDDRDETGPEDEIGSDAVVLAETTGAQAAVPAHESEQIALDGDDALNPSVEDDAFEVDVPVAKVPFYKREISFRKKSTDSDIEGAELVALGSADVAEELSEDPDTVGQAAAGLSALSEPEQMDDPDRVDGAPLEDASASLGREGEGERESEPAPLVLPANEHALERSLPDALGAEGPAENSWDFWTADSESETELDEVAVPAASVADAEPDEAVVTSDERAGEDLPQDGEEAPDNAELPLEDGAPKRRFSSRKDKAPKRKPARGGGGAKGRRVVGLKIGASQIAAAVVVESDGAHELVELVRRPLASGIVVDGEVKDVDALANALKAFFAEENLPKKDVRIGLASNRIGVRTFDIVGIDDEVRFDNAVRFKAHEVLPVAAHESVLDYRVLEERPNEAGEPTRRVLLVVAPKDQVQPYVDVAERAGIKLAGIDLEALGLLRAFVDPKPYAVRAIDDTATVVVSIGHESSTLLVAGGGACEFTRVFDWGGGALVEAIATELEVPPAEAATMLKHLSLSGPGRQFDGLDEVSRAKAVDAVRLRLTPFARELVNSLQFYQTQDESLGIGGIVITGGTSQLEGLDEALNQMIGVNVSVGDPLARVSVVAELDPATDGSIGSMAVPIGLAIDDLAMRGVDLLPKDAAKKRSPRASLVAIGAPVAVAVPLVALGFLYLGAQGKTADNQAELDAVKAEIAALPEPTGPEIDASISGDEAVRATAVALVLGGRVSWDSVLRDMSRILPKNVWLTSLSASAPQTVDPAGAAAAVAASGAGQAPVVPTAVALEGYTFSQPDVARLLARLATLPSLKRVTLTSSQKETVGKTNVVRFSIVADLSQTGGAS